MQHLSRRQGAFSRALALGCVAAASAVVHNCAHDAHVEQVISERTARGKSPELAPRGMLASQPEHSRADRHRRLTQSPVWRPMRFKVDYYDIDAEMDAQTVQYFKQMVIEPAVEYLQGVLMVRQRSGDSGSDSHLQLGYSCPSYYTTSGRCARLDTDRECSSSSVVLNRTYFGAASTFSFEGGQWVETIEPAGGPGAPDADFVLAISASTTGSCGVGSGTLAFASTCLRDDIDRPVAGRYN